MQPENFREQLGLSEEDFRPYLSYHQSLLKWQKAINLIGPNTVSDIWSRHFADSAQLKDFIAKDANIVADLGSGAGFPGLVLSLLMPSKQFYLVESDARKCEFLRNVSRETNCSVEIKNERIEESFKDFLPDVITARAFASIADILSITRHVWKKKKDIEMVLLKGERCQIELIEAQKRYSFSYKVSPSRTHVQGCILCVSDIEDKKIS